MSTTLWHKQADEMVATTLDTTAWIGSTGELTTQRRVDSVLIAPVFGRDDALVALLVPDELAGRVSINGALAATGISGARHADCVEIEGAKYWFAGESIAEETDYSPARHSADVFCFLTKARLREGEPITICPGSPGRPCGMIYKRAAWQTVLAQSNRFRCPNCSFDPQAPRWRPPAPPSRSFLADVLRMLNRENQENGA